MHANKSNGKILKIKEEEIIESFKELPLLIENNRDITSIIDAEVRLDYYVLPKFISVGNFPNIPEIAFITAYHRPTVSAD